MARTTGRNTRTDRRISLSASTPSASLAVRSVRTDAENRAGVGDYIRILGRDLHFEPEDARCGVFFVDGSAARSPEYEVVTNEVVVARVPAGLSAGPYLLRLRRSGGEGGYHELGASSVFIVE
ncbi:MAG: hypothetical protein A2Z99_01705 [Treponema sp. GWB1_62_6]|nr:MAG: hypothetical protein A2Y36_08515 [Treponema sp. GWA1_62_8]OHE64939.1 MAG: hypothetical protein A2001_09620 [Treponema sp. GWC1_61_84]OHE72029.1 MAG: hypothetical protein A2Z99_01705 [Treponema sp. GWB1_62_6]OHE75742.1 MAG: hypothetical protein A2413_04605 [Treponema sp. RIFOXYC1_FULL_61_9]HCM28113.1 hypothetical protein [Treponema sp.]